MSNELDAAAREVRRIFGEAGVIVAPGVASRSPAGGGRWAVGAIEGKGIRIYGTGSKLPGAVLTAERTLGEIIEAAERLPGKRGER